ncbi:atypical protein kinase C [Trichonephila clavata]|uniref:Atypical protein kinase C n=1 Tax=Trichonephila clavata TaxID=2740835 RepID=A0A8X6JMZ0_TRICU|nr:atypical protein kinase C [Trichonephila clavata]
MLAGRSPFDIVGAAENPDQNTEDFLFQVILDKTIRIPRSISVKPKGKQVPPPYKPRLETDRDLEHFDPQFTSEPVVLTPDDLKEIEKIESI